MSYIYSNCSLQMSSNIEWLQALRCLCGLQLLLFDVDVELLLLSSCDGLHLVCESEVCFNHLGDLVLAWITLLNLVPIRLGFVGIGFSTPLQGSTRELRRLCMEKLRRWFKTNFRCGIGSTGECVEDDGGNFRWLCDATGDFVVGSKNI